MTDRFVSKVAMVSGAGSGIGRAVAEQFCREGGRVALIGRTASKLEQVAHQARGDFGSGTEASRFGPLGAGRAETDGRG